MRVLLTGGGTSGHVNPALAIADIIKEKEPKSEFAYIGKETGIEKRLAEREKIPFYGIKSQGFERNLNPSNIKAAYYMLSTQPDAKKIISEFKPDIVIGTGGYVCFVPLLVASRMGIPTVVHESNLEPGLAIKLLKNKVDLILTNYGETVDMFKTAKSETVKVGNPIRVKFGGIGKAEARETLGISASSFVVISLGGSLGAPKINEAAIDVMRCFSSKHGDVIHYHSGGKKYYKDAMQLFVGHNLEKNPRLDVKEYIDDMPLYMAAADVVICRSGAMTLTELERLGKPAILIPSPNVTDNHQYKNAKVLADKGAAILISEGELNAETVTSAVESIYSDKAKAENMSKAILQFANPKVGEEIYSHVSQLVKNKAKIKRKGR